jgi:hypothetical protein
MEVDMSRRRTYGNGELYNSNEFYSLVAFFRSDNGNVDNYLCYSEDGINFQPIELLNEDFSYSSYPQLTDLSVSMDRLVYAYVKWSSAWSVYEYNPVSNSIKQVVITGNPCMPNNPFKCHSYDYYSGYLNIGRTPYSTDYKGTSYNSSDHFISNNDGYYKITITTNYTDKHRIINLYKCDEGKYEKVDEIDTGHTSGSFNYLYTCAGLIRIYPSNVHLYKVKDGKFSIVDLNFSVQYYSYLKVIVINERRELQLIDTYSNSFKVCDFDGNTILEGTIIDSVVGKLSRLHNVGQDIDYGNFKSHFVYLWGSSLLGGEYVSEIVRASDRDYFRTIETCHMNIPSGHTKRYQMYAITCYVPDALFRLNI